MGGSGSKSTPAPARSPSPPRVIPTAYPAYRVRNIPAFHPSPRVIKAPAPAPAPPSAPSWAAQTPSAPSWVAQSTLPAVSASQVVHYDVNNYIIPSVDNSLDDKRPFIIDRGRCKTERFVLHVCSKYTSREGCQTNLCFRFHVCHKWIRGNCSSETCAFDHHFNGEENIDLFNRIWSRNFGENQLCDRIRRNLFFKKNFKEDPESCICMDYILRQCKREACQSYHVPSVYSWEMYSNKHWLQFSKDQKKEIEDNFCNPSVQEVTLDSHITSAGNKNTYRTNMIFKNQIIKINFRSMTMETSDQTIYPVRRLSTPSDVAVFKVVATRWLWYCEGDDGTWNFYTNAYVNDMVIFPFSDYIETQFLKKNSNFTFKLNDYGCEYTISFESMSQLNSSTGQKKKIHRRPMPSKTSEKRIMTFTSFWTNLNAKEKYLRKEVHRRSPEFHFIQKMIVNTVSVGEIFIERVENPYLWEAFQLKKLQMMRQYDNDLQTVSEQYLFHGTSKNVVDKICSDNLDWRLYGTQVGHVYGKGTYFASSAKISKDYASTDEEDYKWMFVCIVLIGRATVGKSQMTLPPIDSVKNERFDTTVNDSSYPQIYVKYNLDEYYPAYLVKFKTY